METPNIFSCGTTELTQDAVFAYIASWADKKYQDCTEHKVALKFIKSLIQLGGASYDQEINTVKAKNQYKRIDVVLIVNDELIIVIENKKGSGAHSNQLQKYKQIIEEDYANKQHIFLYIQSVIESKSHINDIEEKEEYKYIGFDGLLYIIKQCQCDNDIFKEYHDYLLHHKSLHERWQSKEVSKYGWHDVYGLYSCLEKEGGLEGSFWGYANTMSSGLQWFYIHGSGVVLPSTATLKAEKTPSCYLQLEQYCVGKEREKGLRLILKTYQTNYQARCTLLELLCNKGEEHGFKKITKAGRFRKGEYTSTACIYLDENKTVPLRDDKTLNYDVLLEKLVKVKELLKQLNLSGSLS